MSNTLFDLCFDLVLFGQLWVNRLIPFISYKTLIRNIQNFCMLIELVIFLLYKRKGVMIGHVSCP